MPEMIPQSDLEQLSLEELWMLFAEVEAELMRREVRHRDGDPITFYSRKGGK